MSGTVITQFSATDNDFNATLTFSLFDDNGSTHNSLFAMAADGTLSSAAILDHEENATRIIRLKVTDD